MIENLSYDPQAVEAFCRKWRVREFALFGSAVSGEMRADSDVDVLVSFEPDAPWSYFEWADMTQELESIFGRPVDLVEKEALKNPFRRRSILDSRVIIHGA